MQATLILALMLFATPAMAGKKAGVTMPERVTVANRELVLNGMGLREATILKIDVYVAGLYVEHPSSNPKTLVESNEAKLLVLQFVRDVDRSDILDAWNTGFKNNATVPVARLRPLIDQLNRWMPAFKDGNRLSFAYLPGQGVTVTVNGRVMGVIEGEDFARSLFSIWLGPKPPSGALKKGLLGNHTPRS